MGGDEVVDTRDRVAAPADEHVQELVDADQDGWHSEADGQQPEGLAAEVLPDAGGHRSGGRVRPWNGGVAMRVASFCSGYQGGL